jgi:hypothetical protein
MRTRSVAGMIDSGVAGELQAKLTIQGPTCRIAGRGTCPIRPDGVQSCSVATGGLGRPPASLLGGSAVARCPCAAICMVPITEAE